MSTPAPITADCFLCDASTGDDSLPWHDRPLSLDPSRGVAIAGLGGFGVGYILVAPAAHHTSLLQAAHNDPTFPRFVCRTLQHYEHRFGNYTFWEHGGAPGGGRQSACIEHAHLHVAPGRILLPQPPRPREYLDLHHALSDREREAMTGGYLLMGHRGEACYVGDDVCEAQHFRRAWARAVGQPERWDYLLAEDPQITRATIKQFLAVVDGST